jgi:hypothetical protein
VGINFSGGRILKQKEILALFLCLLIGFALRFYTFDQKSLWMDEIYTFNDSRYDIKDQLKYYKGNPTYLHPPLFFILTHQFYPFTKPERDLRIIPLIFGTLSIPMIYFLSRSFSPSIAFPCALSLTFMAYHISLSQDARFYTFLMFFGMVSLYFFMKYLKTLERKYLILVALSFTITFYTHYSVIPFIVLCQLLWFYRIDERDTTPHLYPVSILNGFFLLISLPWVAFVAFNAKVSILKTGLVGSQETVSFWNLLYQTFHDWLPNEPLMVGSGILLILLPFLSKHKRNGFLLLLLFLLPIGGVYLFCKLFHVVHFVSSRYFICFLPLFFVSIYLSLDAIVARFQRLRRLKVVFLIFFLVSNLIMLPSYYRSEKQDYRGLVAYLKGQLHDGDKIVVGHTVYIGIMLHYFGIYPEGRHYVIPGWKVSENEIENRIFLDYGGNRFTILSSRSHWFKYLADGSRLWIVADKENAKIIKQRLSTSVLKGYFDGSFFGLTKFPEDRSIYLFLWDPKSPGEKGIDMPIE